MTKHFLVFIFILCSAASGDDAKKPKCPGGYKEGMEVELGHYWYKCESGQLVPQGCIYGNTRAPIGGTLDSTNNDYRFQCMLDSSGSLAFVYVSCLHNGREFKPSEEWNEEKYYYRCDWEGDHLGITVAGCIDEGRRVKINERVTRANFVYQCRQTAQGTCSMCPVACTRNGREYGIGENFAIDDLWYMCTNRDSSGPIAIRCIGCLNDQKQPMKDGDRFFKDDVVHECTVRQDHAGTRPVGCVQRDGNGAKIERLLGCYWVEGTEPYQYEMTCKEDTGSNTAVKMQTRCSYKPQQGTYTIDPGCYKIVDKLVVACKKLASGALILQILQTDQIGQITAQGLTYC